VVTGGLPSGVATEPDGAEPWSGVRLLDREEDGVRWPVLLWTPGPGCRMVSTAVVGGGIGPRSWWLNAKVSMEYDHPDPAAHVRQIAAAVGAWSGHGAAADDGTCVGEGSDGGNTGVGGGVGMLTAADVTRWTCAEDGGVCAVVTVGLGLPVWAAADDATLRRETGTINVLVRVPVPLADAALVNAVVTATEAKTQALVEAGVPGSGTSSDAVCVACPQPDDLAGLDGRPPVEAYGGPRSPWGLRVARTVHAAVAAGAADWLAQHPDGDPHRRWQRRQ
jgi:adenosylcobinamide amidohydrolase